MNLGISPLQIKIVLESNPPKSTMLAGGLGVRGGLGELLVHGLQVLDALALLELGLVLV